MDIEILVGSDRVKLRGIDSVYTSETSICLIYPLDAPIEADRDILTDAYYDGVRVDIELRTHITPGAPIITQNCTAKATAIDIAPSGVSFNLSTFLFNESGKA